ncbi:hypothetical protein [Brachybacterium muris]|uniref:hypothetical protein n=1 Tax=Brachybacterium muris TaxID=219301 RepID=UPI00223C2E3A|nr:hypothetical protein [Brachybacterium muris]MCT1655150.1 hypothetical protein [Brachybacterium muris]
MRDADESTPEVPPTRDTGPDPRPDSDADAGPTGAPGSPADRSSSHAHSAEETSTFRHVPVLRAWLPFGIVALLIPLIAGLTFSAYILTEGRTSQNFHHIFDLFDVGREYNIPTWYSSMLWALLGVLALVIGSQARRFRISWALLGVVGLAASIDEYQELHERLDAFGIPLLPSLPFAVPFPWLVIGVPLAVVVGLLLLPLVLSLPRRTMLGSWLPARSSSAARWGSRPPADSC